MHKTDDAFEAALLHLEDLLVQVNGELHDGEGVGLEATEVAEDALAVMTQLVAAWKLGRAKHLSVPESVVLDRAGPVPWVSGRRPAAEDIVEKLPWLLGTTLNTLLDDETVSRAPHGGAAIAARMLAATLASLETREEERGAPELRGHDELLLESPAGTTRH